MFPVTVDSAPDEPDAIRLLSHPDEKAFSDFTERDFYKFWQELAVSLARPRPYGINPRQ